MSTQARVPWRPLLAALVLVPCLASAARAERLRVCTFSFHGPEEVQVFKSSLPAEDFEVLDLSPSSLAAPGPEGASPAQASSGARADPWLPGLCRDDLQCDVVVLSAEFAGRFFGRSGRSLGLEEMEEASCRVRCEGLFRSPREVFLLACNTLATKDEDLRGPAVYLQILLGHGFDRATAERVVAMRYGPLGPTFREALRRIFAGVPRIYGFSSAAPLGQYTAPMLERYLDSVGDYREYLDRAQRDPAPNRALQAAFARTDLVQTSGLMPEEPAALDRELVCTLYDDRQPVAARLRIVLQMLERGDRLAFVPSIQVFLDRHPPEAMQGEELALFDEIRRNEAARDQVLGLVQELDASALRLELAHLAVHLGWITQAELRGLAVETVRKMLRRPLSSETVDVVCEVPKHEPVGEEFTSVDIPEPLLHDAEGIRLISCLAPPDARVSVRLAAVLDDPDADERIWASHALTRRLPLPEGVLLAVATHLRDPSPDVADRLRWILRAQRPLPDEVRRAAASADAQLAGELRPR